MRIRRTWLLSLLALASVVPASSGAVFAAGATGLPVIVRPCDVNGNELNGPGYFVVKAKPGSTTHLYALVGNKSNQRAVVSLVPVDAATGVYGGVTAQLASQPRRTVGAWLRVSAHKVKLGPNKGRVVPFTLNVPKHTRPGQYVGALTSFVPSHDTKHGKGFAFTVQTRLADDVVVTVPGPRRWGFQIRGINIQHRTIGTYVISRVRNSGTMMLKGWATCGSGRRDRRSRFLPNPSGSTQRCRIHRSTIPSSLAFTLVPGITASNLRCGGRVES